MKMIFCNTIICFLIFNINSQFNKIDRLQFNSQYYHDTLVLKQDSLKINEKSSFLAGTLSFLLPGFALGQFYNGQYLNGGIRVGISAICITLFASTFSFHGSGNSAPIIAIVLYTFNWLSSVVDAAIYATHINKENKIGSKAKFNYDIINKRLNFSITF